MPEIEKHKTSRPSPRISVTAAAAMLAVLIGGLIFGSGGLNRLQNAANGGGLAQNLATLTPSLQPEKTAEVNAMPTDQDPILLGATEFVATITQEVIFLTGTAISAQANGIFITFTPSPVTEIVNIATLTKEALQHQATLKSQNAGMLPTDPDPLIQGATNFVMTITKEIISMTATAMPAQANGVFITFTPSPVTEIVNIVVAVQPIGRGKLITAEMVALKPRDPNSFSVDEIYSLDEAVGKIARQEFKVNEPLLVSSVVADLVDLGGVPSSLDVPVITSTPIPTIPPVDGPVFPTIVPPIGDTGSAVLPGVENALPVVVARDHIQAGTVLTADMLTFAYYPLESAPEAGYTRLEDAIGITLASFVPRGYPITPILISSSEGTATPIPFDGGAGTVPSDPRGSTATPVPFGNDVSSSAGISTLVPLEDSVVVDLPLELVPVAADNLANVYPGSVLNVVAAVMYIDAGTVDATPVYQVIEPSSGTGALSFTTVYNAIIVEVVNPLDVKSGYVTLRLAPDQAVILNYLIEAHVPMYLSQQPNLGTYPIDGLSPTWVPTATPFPVNIPACQVELSQEGKLYTTPNKDALWIDGLDTNRIFGLLNIIHDQDANLWYQVQTEDGLVMGWIRESESKLIGDNCAADGLLFPPTSIPETGDVIGGSATPLPTVTPLATATPVQP